MHISLFLTEGITTLSPECFEIYAGVFDYIMTGLSSAIKCVISELLLLVGGVAQHLNSIYPFIYMMPKFISINLPPDRWGQQI